MGLDTKSWQPDPDISDADLERMRFEVKDKIIVARVSLLIHHSFFGNMATRLHVKHCDDWCPTAATDGKNLFYNTQFFNALTTQQIEFVIAHEILHCAFDHIGRRDDRDPRIHNIACDYIVNNTLLDQNIGAKVTQLQIYHDNKYRGWSSEEVYDDIFEKMDDDALNALGELLDDHVDWEEVDEEGNRPSYTKEQLRRIREEIKEGVMASAEAAGAGNVPAEIERMIKELQHPKISWRDLIAETIQSTIRSNYTYSRPGRKGWHMNAILPGMEFDERIEVAIALDMSGSIGQEEATLFASEVQGCLDQYQDYQVHIWCFDTACYGYKEFTPQTGDDMTTYNIVGGGGTDFMANYDYMKSRDLQPKKFIMFTDGCPNGSWGDENWCDTVFVIKNDYNKDIKAPFGRTSYFEKT